MIKYYATKTMPDGTEAELEQEEAEQVVINSFACMKEEPGNILLQLSKNHTTTYIELKEKVEEYKWLYEDEVRIRVAEQAKNDDLEEQLAAAKALCNSLREATIRVWHEKDCPACSGYQEMPCICGYAKPHDLLGKIKVGSDS